MCLPPPKPEHLLQLLQVHNQNRIDYNNRKWETVKFFQAVYGALLASCLAALVATQKEALSGSLKLSLFEAALLLVAAIGVMISARNLRRETKLLYLEEFQMFKLSRLLGLDIEIPQEQRWLASDRFLLSDKWRNWQHGAPGKSMPAEDDEALEKLAILWTRHNEFYHLFRALFLAEGVIAMILIAVVFVALDGSLITGAFYAAF